MSFAKYFELAQKQQRQVEDSDLSKESDKLERKRPTTDVIRRPEALIIQVTRGKGQNGIGIKDRLKKDSGVESASRDDARESLTGGHNLRGRRHREADQRHSLKPNSLIEDSRHRAAKRARHATGVQGKEKKVPPAPESLALSEKLRKFSRLKLADKAIATYWATDYDNFRDSHHACMLVDCCARVIVSGSYSALVTEAERVVADRASLGQLNVELQTALIKLYARAGLVSKGADRFATMCRATAKPNVRTINTLLRSCLWTAVAQGESPGELVGTVSVSEAAWKLYREHVTRKDALDASSFEYSTILLCQALNVEAAEVRIEELQAHYNIRLKGRATFVAGEEDSQAEGLETLAVLYLALSRAYALLGRINDTWLACQRVLSAVQLGRKCRDGPTKDSQGPKPTSGGKRSWNAASDSEQQIRRRVDSNSAYRDHKLREVERETRALLRFRREKKGLRPIAPQDLFNRLKRFLIYFPPDEGSCRKKALLSSATASWYSYGGCVLAKTLGITSLTDMRHEAAIREDGTINFESIFAENKNSQLDIELGSGYGDWIARTAAAQPNRNHLAVELRSDRVHQIFTKAVLSESGQPLCNLCVVCSDAGSFLRYRVAKRSVSTIYVHHPEPPTQTLGSRQSDLDSILSGHQKDEATHMLHSATIVSAAHALQPDGKLIIVTDNRHYGRLICATITKVLREHPKLFRGPTTTELKNFGLHRSESTGTQLVALYERQSQSPPSRENHGAPSLSSSPPAATSTWFDRLWNTPGASSHAERHTRYVILMYR
jgi:tRNA G46 methylase TrmB